MKYLHTMVRVSDLDGSLDFYCTKLGLVELRRYDEPKGRFTNVFLAVSGDDSAQVELTYNWDPEEYGAGRNFGHLAYQVENIYALCQHLMDEDDSDSDSEHDVPGRCAALRSGCFIGACVRRSGVGKRTGLPATGRSRLALSIS